MHGGGSCGGGRLSEVELGVWTELLVFYAILRSYFQTDHVCTSYRPVVYFEFEPILVICNLHTYILVKPDFNCSLSNRYKCAPERPRYYFNQRKKRHKFTLQAVHNIVFVGFVNLFLLLGVPQTHYSLFKTCLVTSCGAYVHPPNSI